MLLRLRKMWELKVDGRVFCCPYRIIIAIELHYIFNSVDQVFYILSINFGSGNGLVLLGINPLSEANIGKPYHPWDPVIMSLTRDHSGYGLGQWEKALHSNASSQWLNPCPKRSPSLEMLRIKMTKTSTIGPSCQCRRNYSKRLYWLLYIYKRT